MAKLRAFAEGKTYDVEVKICNLLVVADFADASEHIGNFIQAV